MWLCRLQHHCGHASPRVKHQRTVLESSCENESYQLKCPFMNCNSLCRDMHACECVDYANGHICKHLHGVDCLRLMSQTSKSNDDYLSDTIGIFIINHKFLCTLSGYTLLYDTSWKLMRMLALWKLMKKSYFLPVYLYHKVYLSQIRCTESLWKQ